MAGNFCVGRKHEKAVYCHRERKRGGNVAATTNPKEIERGNSSFRPSVGKVLVRDGKSLVLVSQERKETH